MQHSHSREANRNSHCQRRSHILWNLEVMFIALFTTAQLQPLSLQINIYLFMYMHNNQRFKLHTTVLSVLRVMFQV